MPLRDAAHATSASYEMGKLRPENSPFPYTPVYRDDIDYGVVNAPQLWTPHNVVTPHPRVRCAHGRDLENKQGQNRDLLAYNHIDPFPILGSTSGELLQRARPAHGRFPRWTKLYGNGVPKPKDGARAHLEAKNAQEMARKAQFQLRQMSDQVELAREKEVAEHETATIAEITRMEKEQADARAAYKAMLHGPVPHNRNIPPKYLGAHDTVKWFNMSEAGRAAMEEHYLGMDVDDLKGAPTSLSYDEETAIREQSAAFNKDLAREHAPDYLEAADTEKWLRGDKKARLHIEMKYTKPSA